jgi:hypothetical protein
LAALLAAAAVAGCGSSAATKPKAATGPSSLAAGALAAIEHPKNGGPRVLPPEVARSRVSRASIGIGSEAKLPSGLIASQFTCAGADMSPPIVWEGVPPSAKELVVVVRTLTEGHLITNWMVGGVSPSAVGLEPGKLPRGAVVGVNSFGEDRYHLCPPKGRTALIVFGMWASPTRLSLQQGFKQRDLASVVGNPEVSWGSLLLHSR